MNNFVNKNKFIEVYKRNAPNKFILFMYGNFIKKGKLNSSEYIIISIFSILFILIPIFKDDIPIMRTLSLILFSFLGVFVIANIVAIKLNNLRINKIKKILNIDDDEYENLYNKYMK